MASRLGDGPGLPHQTPNPTRLALVIVCRTMASNKKSMAQAREMSFKMGLHKHQDRTVPLPSTLSCVNPPGRSRCSTSGAPAMAALGNLLAYASCVTSLATTLIGLIYVSRGGTMEIDGAGLEVGV